MELQHGGMEKNGCQAPELHCSVQVTKPTRSFGRIGLLAAVESHSVVLSGVSDGQ